jgi:UDP-glucose 4-epimerase
VKKIGVLGGGGFVGSAICDKLLAHGYAVKIFERPGVQPCRKFTNSEQLEWITGDFLSLHDVENFIKQVDIIIHLISTTIPSKSNEATIFDVESNLLPTLQLLEAMHRQSINKIIFISSGGTIYGNPIDALINEDHPTNPIVSYGVTKLAIEKFLLLYKSMHALRVVILRVSNPYGEGQRLGATQGAVGVFLNKAIKNQAIEIWGDGNIVRDYIYVDDVAEAVLKSIYYTGKKSIFNIGSGAGVSINYLIETIQNFLNRNIVIEYKSSRAFDVTANVLDINLAKNELNWIPRTSFVDGINKTISYVLKNTV